MERLEGELKGSTTYVMEEAIIKVMRMDAASMHDTLNFELFRNWIHTEVLRKALHIVINKKKQVRISGTHRLALIIH